MKKRVHTFASFISERRILNYNAWSAESRRIDENNSVHEYGCAMIYYDMPEMKDLHSKIEEKDIYYSENEDGSKGHGLETDPHVTLLYGFHDDKVDPEEVLEICESFEYPKLELKNVSLFENDDYDVLKFEVNAKVLHEINDRLKKFPHTNNYPEYHPHCTIAYLKKGRGKKYVKMLEGTSIEVTPSKIVYSRPDGSVKYRKIKRNE